MADRLDHITRLTSVPTEMEAGLIAAALEEEGLDSSVTGEFTSGFRAEAPGQVQILVAEQDLARARTVLSQCDHEGDNIDWSQVDVGEAEESAPAVDSAGVTLWRRVAQVLIFLILILVGINLARALADITESIYAEITS